MEANLMKYLGTKYTFGGTTIEEGFDCLTLCCAIAKERGYYIPNINHSHHTLKTHHIMLTEHANTPSLWQEFDSPTPDTLVTFKINGALRHVGYMLDTLHFIHITDNAKVTIEKLTSPQWERRIYKFYRYIGHTKN